MSQPIPDTSPSDRLARAAHAAHAAQALSESLWEALHEELAAAGPPGGSTCAVELSERLSQIAATVALLAAASPPSATPSSSPEPVEPTFAPQDTPAGTEPPPAPPPSHRRRPEVGEEEAELTPAIIVDERLPPEPPGGAPDESHAESPSAGDIAPPIEIRDTRATPPQSQPPGDSDRTPWIASIDRRLERYARDRLPFAVLLLELVGVDRLRHAELPGEVARLTGLVEAALAAELRPADSLMRESPGRYWLLAPETDTATAKQLATRLAAAVRAAASHRGVPLALAAGIAVCPDDGRHTAALVAQADIALYAAHAVGPPPSTPAA